MKTIATAIAAASVSLTTLAVTRICMREFERAVVAATAAEQAGDRARQRELAWQARKWSRRMTAASLGQRRLIDAVIRWL